MEANVIKKDPVSTHRAAANDESSNLNSQQPTEMPLLRKPGMSAGGVNSIRQTHITMKPI